MFRFLVSTRALAPIEYIVNPLARGRGVLAHEGRIPRPDGEIPPTPVWHGQRRLGYGIVFPPPKPAIARPHRTVTARFCAAYTLRFSRSSPFPSAIVTDSRRPRIPDILFLGGCNCARHHRCLPLFGVRLRCRRRLSLSLLRRR